MSRSNNFIILFFNPSPNRRKRNKIIAAVNGPEKQDTMEHSFSLATKEINSVLEAGSLRVMGKKYELKFFLREYNKFLLMARELSGATSTYACLWCLSHKLD